MANGLARDKKANKYANFSLNIILLTFFYCILNKSFDKNFLEYKNTATIIAVLL